MTELIINTTRYETTTIRLFTRLVYFDLLWR